jgi:glycine cleavage system H protein
MAAPGTLLFSRDHEWVRLDGGSARVGITDFAQDALGDVVFVQLPSMGATVTSGQSVSEVESTKSVSDIYSPLNGTISAVNVDLGSDPSLLNSDPFGLGWIYELSVDVDVDLGQLIDEDAYRRFVKE